jgi:hypothetical protein
MVNKLEVSVSTSILFKSIKNDPALYFMKELRGTFGAEYVIECVTVQHSVFLDLHAWLK